MLPSLRLSVLIIDSARRRQYSTKISTVFCIKDVAVQFSFGLPHFATETKDTQERSLKARVISLLEYMKPKKLHPFAMTE